MSSIEWTVFLLIALVISGDVARTEFRDWRARRLAIRNGRTLTTKFGLPLV
jgi:hypothetical protein